jgi:hypothetical protein
MNASTPHRAARKLIGSRAPRTCKPRETTPKVDHERVSRNPHVHMQIRVRNGHGEERVSAFPRVEKNPHAVSASLCSSRRAHLCPRSRLRPRSGTLGTIYRVARAFSRERPRICIFFFVGFGVV